eukprot:TRINITY_DN4148_c0_g1_i1.p1 TRINITY_DN4148_c0_g1~~TRINITY_DN4148_c0_g1_i1.p1  ORF type:complete len:244 (+),score=51.14 TRINITY_DN4148_c0_g1_i1:55-732(+)
MQMMNVFCVLPDKRRVTVDLEETDCETDLIRKVQDAAIDLYGVGISLPEWVDLRTLMEGDEVPITWDEKELAMKLLNEANVTSINEWGLRMAVVRGNTKLVELFLKAGLDIQYSDDSGESLLHLAALHGDRDVLELLLAFGASPTATNTYGSTPLHVANSLEVIEILFHSTPPNSVNNYGNTPLHSSAFKRNRAASDLLISLGSDPSIRNDLGLTFADIFDMRQT